MDHHSGDFQVTVRDIRQLSQQENETLTLIWLLEGSVELRDGESGRNLQADELAIVNRHRRWSLHSKTANVVMSCAFGADAIAVDTHVFRVANRLGLADAPDVLKTEHQLMQNIPQSQWSRAHHWLIYHGRRVCAARKPACESCTLRAWCEYANGNPKGKK